MATMLNADLFEKLLRMADYPPFRDSISLTPRAIEEQKHVELVLRFLAFRYKKYQSTIDVHDWLDEILIDISQDPHFDIDGERIIFEQTFQLLVSLLGNNTFKRFDGAFGGSFSIAAFEAITHGVSSNLPKVTPEEKHEILVARIQAMWTEFDFIDSTKAGTRGSTRLGKLLPFAKAWFDI